MRKTLKKRDPLPGPRATEREIATFWDTHDLTDYLDQMESVDEVIRVAPSLVRQIRERTRKRLLSIRLETWQIEQARKIAKRRRVPYQTLLRSWIEERLRREQTVGG